jgi:predicted AlkP superfamily phosphohydrolase/phosphomutase
MEKLVILGIDGASWELINLLIDDNYLPNIKKIIQNGVSGTLNSTIPPITGPAWTSFATGKSPENHGIYDFVTHEEGQNKLLTSNEIIGKTFYEILSEHGLRSVLIGLPMSYPPKKINGIILPDTFSPKKYAYPASAKKYLENYRVTPKYRLKGKEAVDDLISFTNEHAEVAKAIFENEPWDLFFMLFPASDSISHKYFGDMINKTKIGMEAIKIFQRIDKCIGWFLKNAPKETTFFIVSDHGFQECNQAFFINSYLKENDLLDVKLNSENRIKEIQEVRENGKRKELFLDEKIYNLFKFKPIKKLAWNIKTALNKLMGDKYHLGTGYIPDPKKSKLFMPTQSSYCLLVNQNVDVEIDEIASILEKLHNEENDEPIFLETFQTNIEGQDRIYFQPSPGWFINPGMTDDIIITAKHNSHEREGIFIAYGNNIRKNEEISDNNLFDIAPTILRMFQISPPVDMDGQAIDGIFKKDYAKESKAIVKTKRQREKLRIQERISQLKKI